MIEGTLLNRYKYVIDSVIPASSGADWKNYDRCYMGVSLGTLPFKSPFIDALLEWVSLHYSRCAVVIGDSIHRLTLQIVGNWPEHAAAEEAHRLGCAFLKDNRQLFGEWPACKFEFLQCSIIQQSPDYKQHEQVLSNLFLSDTDFASSIRASALPFVNRHRRGKGDTVTAKDKMIALACRYVLEEMAMFACLVNLGWRVEVYPGRELPILIEIAKGRYPAVPQELRDRINIALRLKAITPRD